MIQDFILHFIASLPGGSIHSSPFPLRSERSLRAISVPLSEANEINESRASLGAPPSTHAQLLHSAQSLRCGWGISELSFMGYKVHKF